ncbi:prephenate dehydratase [Petrocella sp. FN5]|uniref:prephenate dehydratase n=1 Tax=Petrocella sp. FN5 TaxID=3032002 RepID=UPI0023DC4200|nr:prephenate dehydratase domain-containing protein [Petrocella sp. FN5]MDF1616099.1 prephenate dehydratase domain-containing protein [Petrocella sp. FN5]
MDKIAVLGPKGTFTELATKKYLETQSLEMELAYYPSMRKTFEAVGSNCKYGVIPIENTLDGFVQIILDLLTHTNLKIIHEIVLPVRFAFVGNSMCIKDIKKVYAQFKSENQCLDFLEQFRDVDIITTASNSQSYEEVIKGDDGVGAIIPIHMLHNRHDFRMVIENITDSMDNETRFIIVSQHLNEEVVANRSWKTFFVVSDDLDRPGLLCDILNTFSREKINLKSIISRPTKTGLGNYNFFIDIDGCYQKDEHVREAIAHVYDKYNIKILGSYYRVLPKEDEKK